jgi:hypothetical protein
MVDHMKQLLVQIDDRTAALLESVVPARSRKRSEFIRRAIAQALLEIVDLRTRAAYGRHPDDATPPFDPAAWAPEHEAIHRPARRRRR